MGIPLGGRKAVLLPEQTLLKRAILLGCDCDAVRCASHTPSRLASCSLPITYTVALGRLFVTHHIHRHFWSAARCRSHPLSTSTMSLLEISRETTSPPPRLRADREAHASTVAIARQSGGA